jgi:HAD superfamily hydrolase (TIGR01509 family)
MAPLEAVVFDVDGTLVDSTYLHVIAWSRAFADAGEQVGMAAIHREIGEAADRLVADLLGREDPSVVERHGHHFGRLHPEIRAFPGAADLLRSLAGRGVAVVLATSAKEEDDAVNQEALDVRDVVAACITPAQVSEAKPAPDLFSAALDAVGVAPGAAVAVGDSVWGVEAAARAGMACIGVRSGGLAAEELLAVGAAAVYDGPADLTAHVEDWLVAHR